MSYTAITPNYLPGKTAGGLPVSQMDLNSMLSAMLAESLGSAWQFALIGSFTSLAAYQASLQAFAEFYLTGYPFTNGGIAPDALVAQYANLWLTWLNETPLDPSGRLAAGMIANHLGAIPKTAGGSIDLSQFSPVPPPSVPTVDPYDAAASLPPGQPYSLYGWIQTMAGARWVLLAQNPGAMAWYTAPKFVATNAPAAPFSNAN